MKPTSVEHERWRRVEALTFLRERETSRGEWATLEADAALDLSWAVAQKAESSCLISKAIRRVNKRASDARFGD